MVKYYEGRLRGNRLTGVHGVDFIGAVQCLLAEQDEVALQVVGSGNTPVDLILSYLMMPIMDGYTLLEKLKSDDTARHIPVTMLTARADPTDRLHALYIGVDDYMTKPFDEEELRVRITNLLKTSRSGSSSPWQNPTT